MAVTVYRWDDASAPALSASNGALIAVLDACLVDGYGAKAPAGWTKAYSGTNKAAYLQGTGGNGHYLRVDNSTSNQYPRWRGYEAMSDVDTGTGLFPTELQVAGGLYLQTSTTSDATARPWVIVADAKRFYFYIGHSDTRAVGLASTGSRNMFFFGSIVSYKANDAYHTLIIANTTAAINVVRFGTLVTDGTAVTGHYMARAYHQAGSSTGYAKTSDQRAEPHSVLGTAAVEYPDPVSGGMLLVPVFLTEPVNFLTRGHLPGVWNPLHPLPGNPGDTFSGTATGGLNGKSFLLLDTASTTTRGRVALEISDTWE